MAPKTKSQRRKKKADRQPPPPALQFRHCLSPDWDGFSDRRIHWAFSGQETSVTFESVFKVSRMTFNSICDLVKDEIKAKSTMYTDLSGHPLSLIDRVAIALRRLSSGDSIAVVGNFLGVTQSTVHLVTWWFVKGMEKKAHLHLRWPSTEEELREIKSKFEKIQGLPNCCGVIDITNIRFSRSSGDPTNEVWLDKENNASMVMQAIVGPEMRFLDILTGFPGRLSDSVVLESSKFFTLSEEGRRLNGEILQLSNEAQLREYIIGDEGFPLLPWLITPFSGRKLTEAKKDFNKRHHETWMVAQMALKRFKETWGIIGGVMSKPDKHKLPRIIFVCCLLHNILIDQNDGVLQVGTSNWADHNPNYKQQKSFFIHQIGAAQRRNIALYLAEKYPSN